MKMVKILDDLKSKAKRVRATCIYVSHKCQAPHLGSSLSAVEIIVALYYNWLKLNPSEPRDPARDRFILSKGHGCIAYYAALADKGFFPLNWLEALAKDGSPLGEHPCSHTTPGVELSTGSLGHGLGVATGIALGLKMDRNPSRVVVLLSDGECNEGSLWESVMFAKAKKLNNILAIVDYNGLQANSRTDEISGGTSLLAKWNAFGWAGNEVDGHDLQAILKLLEKFPFSPSEPSVIIARTVKGKGVSFMENNLLWHYHPPDDEEYRVALSEIGATPLEGVGSL